MRLPWKSPLTIISHTLWNLTSGAVHRVRRAEEFKELTLAGQSNYWDAKKHGNYEAAFDIVGRLMSRDALKLIADKVRPEHYSDTPYNNRPHIVAPVKAGGTKNRLPIALAHRLSYEFGLPVDRKIIQVDDHSRTGKSALSRLLHQAEFTGDVQVGRQYVIADDVYTHGGSIAGLAGYIEGNGGKVICATALANQSHQVGTARERFKARELPLSIEPETLRAIERNCGYGFGKKFEEAVGFPLAALTQREGSFMARFRCKKTFLDAVDDERSQAAYVPTVARYSEPARRSGGIPASQPA